MSSKSKSTDRVALVTGSGAERVGNCVARSLATEGYRIVLHARRSVATAEQTADELRGAGVEAMVVTGDVRLEEDVRRMVADAHDWFGRIDVLVNCAAVWDRIPLEQITADDVRRHFEVNALGTFLCCQQVGLRMVEQTSGGVIINVGDWAIERPYLDYAAYFPSKGAIPALTRSLAVELAKRNPKVRVNAVLPGPVMLPDDLPAAERQAAIAQTLVRREGSPEHVAHTVRFLIENEFVTGVCIPVDGGRTIHSHGT